MRRGAGARAGDGLGGGRDRRQLRGQPRPGLNITVTAAAGKANILGFAYLPTFPEDVYLRDTAAGITGDSPHCVQTSPTEVRCLTQGLERLSVFTGDLNDVVSGFIPLSALPTIQALVVNTGTGNDFVEAQFKPAAGDLSTVGQIKLGSGNDGARIAGPATAKGKSGRDKLRGGKRRQRLFGGGGIDFLFAGKGKDFCHGGAKDERGGGGCEKFVAP